MSQFRFFLGGHDLEMVEIGNLLREAGFGDAVVDKTLSWGTRASACEAEIRAALGRGEMPVLIELENDLPADIGRSRLIEIDHHGARAGKDRPSSLRQIHHLIDAARRPAWTRHHALVAANDIGYVPAMRALGATPQEIRAIRDADRRAQGITAQIEAESRRAIRAAEREGSLTVVRTSTSRISAISDFLLPDYGGPGVQDLVVLSPGEITFFGRGAVIEKLRAEPRSWYGGALPEAGFWGARRTPPEAAAILDRIRMSLGLAPAGNASNGTSANADQ